MGGKCTFFGHREIAEDISLQLHRTIEALICKDGVSVFYVGNQGQFDMLVLAVLREMKQRYPHISYAVVLAYFPATPVYGLSFEETMIPEGIETVPPRYAIHRRNRWMLKESDYVIGYVNHSWGGAAQFLEIAKKQGKHVINLGKLL